MEFLTKLYQTLRHLSPDSMDSFIAYLGATNVYITMFVIVFCETGLVVTPFLPGDSLIFALGAVIGGKGAGASLSLPVTAILLIVAAILGDAVNYWIGYRLGPKVFSREDSRLLNKKHLLRAQEFYERYGGKTIILARFVPIVRTFAPFVAGVGRMNYLRFFLYNVVGGVAWVMICLMAGYWLGTVELIKKHFELVIVAIVLISVLPVVIELLRARAEGKRKAAEIAAAAKPSSATQIGPLEGRIG